MVKTDYTREELIALCRSGIVPHEKWHNRDSCSAQMQLGVALGLLMAGCKFRVLVGGSLPTDEQTVWIRFTVRDFEWFEYGEEDGGNHTDAFYIPTLKRLRDAGGEDWY